MVGRSWYVWDADIWLVFFIIGYVKSSEWELIEEILGGVVLFILVSFVLLFAGAVVGQFWRCVCLCYVLECLSVVAVVFKKVYGEINLFLNLFG